MKFILEYKEFDEENNDDNDNYIIDTTDIKEILNDVVDEYDNAVLDIFPVHFWKTTPSNWRSTTLSKDRMFGPSKGHEWFKKDSNIFNCYYVSITFNQASPSGSSKQQSLFEPIEKISQHIFQKIKTIKEYYQDSYETSLLFLIQDYEEEKKVPIHHVPGGVRFFFYIANNPKLDGWYSLLDDNGYAMI